MAKRQVSDRAATRRAERSKRKRRSGSGEAGGSGSGGLMLGLRGGFKSAVHGKKRTGRQRALSGWLPLVVLIFAALLVIRRLGLF